MRTLVGRFAVLAAASTFLVACGGGGGTDDGGSDDLLIAANGSTSFSGTAGTALAGGVPSVKVTDEATGTPKAGVGITFSVTGGGGTLAGATQTTNAEGIATVGGWTLGTAAGANSVRAVVSSQNSLVQNFTATGAAGAAARLVWSTQPASNVTAGAAIGALTVDVADQFGNRVTSATNDVAVAFGSNPGATTLGGTTSAAAATGRASFGNLTISKAAANYTLTATSAGLTAGTSSFFTVNAATPAALVKSAGDNQAGVAGGAVAVRPSVTIADQFGNPVSGAAVVFAVASGGGTVSGANQTTNASGVATVGGWTLGTAGANTLTATVAGAPAATFTATAATAASAYNIEVRYIGAAPSAGVQTAFANAASRWSQVVIGDLPDVNTGTFSGAAPGSCGEPNFPETRNTAIDDLLLYAEVAAIDGAGGTLGQAKACATVSGKSVIGYMKFDSADLTNMVNNGTIGDVILHEMGHVIGIGGLSGWYDRMTPTITDTAQIRTSDMRYTGAHGNAAYFAFGSGATGSGAPIENCGAGSPSTCGNGNWLGHWRETVFQNELMTGFVSAASNPMSRMTIGALKDLGYDVDMAAANTYGLPVLALFSGTAPRGVELNEIPYRGPVYEIDTRGNIVRRLQ